MKGHVAEQIRRELAGGELRIDYPVPPGRLQIRRCPDCGESITFCRTRTGKSMPLHVESRATYDGVDTMEPHWGFCSRAKKARKARPSRRRPYRVRALAARRTES